MPSCRYYDNLKEDAAKLTIFDVPGEYNNMLYKPKGVKYALKESPAAFQTMGMLPSR